MFSSYSHPYLSTYILYLFSSESDDEEEEEAEEGPQIGPEDYSHFQVSQLDSQSAS